MIKSSPGSWIGVFGGGQLGRMLTHAAQRMGYHVAIHSAEQDSPAIQSANRRFSDASVNGQSPTSEMAQLCDVVTVEFENVAAGLIETCSRHTRTHPNVRFLEVCQDRYLEKSTLAKAGFPTTPFRHVSSIEETIAAGEQLGWPMVLKTTRSGYDRQRAGGRHRRCRRTTSLGHIRRCTGHCRATN